MCIRDRRYIAWYIKRNYPWIELSVKPNFQSISQKSAVLVHQVSSLVFSHTDVLVLTFVCGLRTVSIYSMYATIYAVSYTHLDVYKSQLSGRLIRILQLF